MVCSVEKNTTKLDRDFHDFWPASTQHKGVHKTCFVFAHTENTSSHECVFYCNIWNIYILFLEINKSEITKHLCTSLIELLRIQAVKIVEFQNAKRESKIVNNN